MQYLMAMPSAATPALAQPNKNRHLIVLQHGMRGAAKNLDFLTGLLNKAVSDKELPNVVILNSAVNEMYLTFEGADACGGRLVTLITQTCEEAADQGQPVTHLSLIGYSLGGLVMRYAVGKLWTAGLIKAKGAPLVQSVTGPAMTPLIPVNFITVACPHLGTWVQPTSWLIRTTQSMVPRLAARSGTQFMLMDRHAFGRPIIVNMSDPELPFLQGLATFPNLMLLANILYDRTVPYCTAAICEDNPYDTHDSVPIDPQYPSIVKPIPRAPARARKPAAKAVFTAEGAGAISKTGDGNGVEEGHAASMDGGGGQCAAARAGQREKKPPARKGGWVLVTLALLFPLTFPLATCLLVYYFWNGRKQWASVRGQTFDHAWVEAAALPTALVRRHNRNKSGAAPGSDPALALPPPSAPATTATATSRATLTPDPPPSILDGSAGAATEAQTGAEVHSTSVRDSLDLAAAGERDRGQRVEVNIDGSRELTVHDGLVDTAGKEREAQLWMLRQMNKLPWKKVDVDTRHYHAHPAIIVRNPRRFRANADTMQFLVDHMVLDVRQL